MTSLFHKIAQKALNENLLVAYKENQEESRKFYVGFIKAVNEEELYVNLINQYGEDNGFSWVKLKNIYQLTYNDRYLQRMMLLREHNPGLSEEQEEDDRASNLFDSGSFESSDGADILRSLIQRLIEGNVFIHLDLAFDNWTRGFILDADEDFILVEEISADGDEDGFSCFKIDHIESVTGQTNYLKKIEFFFDNREKFYKK